MQRWANIQRTARIMVNPMATFAACGFAFAAAQCASYHNLGREDTLNGVVGGLAVGAVIGLKRASLASAIGYGSMFAGVVWGEEWGRRWGRAAGVVQQGPGFMGGWQRPMAHPACPVCVVQPGQGSSYLPAPMLTPAVAVLHQPAAHMSCPKVTRAAAAC
jgi:hypothetical protein